MENSRLIRLTGLWKNKSKDGNPYLSGNIIPGLKLLVFPNHAEGDKQPQYIAFLAPVDKEQSLRPEANRENGDDF